MKSAPTRQPARPRVGRVPVACCFMDRGEYQFVADDRPCLVGQFQVRDLRFFADVANGHDLGQLRPSRRAVPDGVCPTQQRPRTSGSQPGSVSSPTPARWPTIPAVAAHCGRLTGYRRGCISQTDPFHVDSW